MFFHCRVGVTKLLVREQSGLRGLEICRKFSTGSILIALFGEFLGLVYCFHEPAISRAADSKSVPAHVGGHYEVVAGRHGRLFQEPGTVKRTKTSNPPYQSY